MCLAFTKFHVGFTKLGNDLIHCVTFLRHYESPVRAVRPSKILSLTMVQFYRGEITPVMSQGVRRVHLQTMPQRFLWLGMIRAPLTSANFAILSY